MKSHLLHLHWGHKGLRGSAVIVVAFYLTWHLSCTWVYVCARESLHVCVHAHKCVGTWVYVCARGSVVWARE